MLRQGDATKRVQEGNEEGVKLFLFQIFRLRESCPLALLLSDQNQS